MRLAQWAGRSGIYPQEMRLTAPAFTTQVDSMRADLLFIQLLDRQTDRSVPCSDSVGQTFLTVFREREL